MFVSKSIKLGPLETRLILELEKNDKIIFDFQDAKDILAVSTSSVANVIYRLKNKNRIEEIKKGKYVLSPARSGIEGYWMENIFLIVDSIAKDYYVGFWTAMHYWNMTEQIPTVTQVATTKQSRDLVYSNQKINFIKISKNRFFGEVKEKVDNNTFKISSKEKTILDALTYPQHCGGIPEAAKAIRNSREELDWGVLVDFLERLNVSAVKRRLGYVLEVLEIKGGVKSMLESDFRGYRWLDPSVSKTKFNYDKKWGLKLNLRKEKLLEWRDY